MNGQGTVQEIGTSQKGTPKLKIDGFWYSAGKCDVSSVQPGQTISFVWNEFGEPRNGKKPRGISAWGFMPSNGHAQQPMQGQVYPQTQGVPSSALDDADRPFISNIVAHAIAAGLIKEPEVIEKWAVAAQAAMRRLKGEQHGLNGPPDEGEIPYKHSDDPGW